jgi:hypothetical protein
MHWSTLLDVLQELVVASQDEGEHSADSEDVELAPPHLCLGRCNEVLPSLRLTLSSSPSVHRPSFCSSRPWTQPSQCSWVATKRILDASHRSAPCIAQDAHNERAGCLGAPPIVVASRYA